MKIIIRTLVLSLSFYTLVARTEGMPVSVHASPGAITTVAERFNREVIRSLPEVINQNPEEVSKALSSLFESASPEWSDLGTKLIAQLTRNLTHISGATIIGLLGAHLVGNGITLALDPNQKENSETATTLVSMGTLCLIASAYTLLTLNAQS